MIGINLDALKREHAKFLNAHDGMLRLETERAATLAKSHVRTHSTFKRQHTPGLKDDTRTTIRKVGGGYRLHLRWARRYAGFVEYGTRAHVITPRGPGYPLRFYWKKIGRWVATYKVQHPGTRPYKFGYRATTAAYRQLGEMLSNGMRRVAN
jgi:hypothetical protein